MSPVYIQLVLLVVTSGLSLGAHIWVIRWGRRTRKVEVEQPQEIIAIGTEMAVIKSQVQDLRQDMHDAQTHLGNLREATQRILSRINGTEWKRQT